MNRFLNWYRQSVSNRILTLTFGLITALTTGLGFVIFGLGTQFIQETSDRLLQRELDAAQERLVTELTQTNRELATLSQNALVLNALGDPTGRSAYLDPLMASHTLADQEGLAIAVLNFKGDVISQSGERTVDWAAFAPFVGEVLSSGIPKAVVSGSDDAPILWIAYPLFYPTTGKPEGLVLTQLMVRSLMQMQLPLSTGRQWQLQLGGSVIDMTDQSYKESVFSPQAQLALPRPLDGLQAKLVVADDRDPSKPVKRKLLLVLVAVFFVALTIGFFSSRYLGRYLIQPLLALSKLADAVAAGGLGSFQIKSQANDEIGRLAKGFSAMLEQLRRAQEDLETKVAVRTQELTQAQLDLVDRSQRLAQILELSPDGFVEITAGGQIGFGNLAFERITGLSVAQFSGAPLGQLADALGALQRTDHVPKEKHLSHILSGLGMSNELTIVEFQPPANKVVALGLFGDQAAGRLIYLRDISQQSNLDKMKADFLSTAAHELRTPLASISGFAELLQRGRFTDEKRKELLAIIHRHAMSMTALINDLLAIVRAEAKAGRDYLMQVQLLTPILKRAVEDFRIADDPRDLVLRLDDHLPMARFDAEKVRQVINNLLSNAFKYSEKGSPIEIATVVRRLPDANWVGFRVKDYGVGMSETDLNHLFERFYRANPQGRVPGTGLGLALVKEIVDQHNGRIEVDSALGKGTAVTVLLPIVTPTA